MEESAMSEYRIYDSGQYLRFLPHCTGSQVNVWKQAACQAQRHTYRHLDNGKLRRPKVLVGCRRQVNGGGANTTYQVRFPGHFFQYPYLPLEGGFLSGSSFRDGP